MKAFQREEIFWRSDCPTSRLNLYDHVEPLEEARDLQQILMLINIFSNVFIGVLIPALLIRNACVAQCCLGTANRALERTLALRFHCYDHIVLGRLYGDVPCIPGKGEDEKRIIDVCKTWLSLFFRVGKVCQRCDIESALIALLLLQSFMFLWPSRDRLGQFIPLVLVTVLIHQIKDFFEEAASVDCSDATTEATVRPNSTQARY